MKQEWELELTSRAIREPLSNKSKTLFTEPDIEPNAIQQINYLDVTPLVSPIVSPQSE